MPGEDLIEAAESGDVKRVKGALQIVSARDTAGLGAGKSPVQEALYRGHREVVEFLRSQWQLDICEAAAVGDLGRVEELIGMSPESVNSFSYDGWTPLHLAAFLGHAQVAERLIQAGAKVAALSSNYMANTPLHAALAGAGSKQVVEVLIGAGTEVNIHAGAGVTPLHNAASRGADQLVDLLLAAGADPHAKMDEGKTPADIARERGHTGLAERLERL